jgi:hypothetical protein
MLNIQRTKKMYGDILINYTEKGGLNNFINLAKERKIVNIAIFDTFKIDWYDTCETLKNKTDYNNVYKS